MSSGSAKQIKKQAMALVREEMNERLDSIENYCKDALTNADKRAKAIQSWIIQEVTGKIASDLNNANITIDAVVEVLANAGIQIEDFAGKVDACKVVIAQRRDEEAKQRLADKLAAQQEQVAAQQAQAQESQPQPVAEQPAVESSST